jgi:hypothetical protein
MKFSINYFLLIFFLLLMVSCEKEDNTIVVPSQIQQPAGPSFVTFSTDGQTLPEAIHTSSRKVLFEVDHFVDVTQLVPKFAVSSEAEVYLNGVKQESGISKVDFTNPVQYEIREKSGSSVTWEAAAVKLQKKILIDASHDGGGWWFPQSPLTGFDAAKPHQGKVFADMLRASGYIVDELGRGTELSEEMFFGYYIIVRASGFFPYSAKDLSVYTNLLKRGMNLVFFTDHKKNDPVDELGDYLGLHFKGIAYGVINKFKSHALTENLTSLDYIAGAFLTDYENNKDIEVLGWLREQDYGDLNMNGVWDQGEPSAPAVMWILKYPKSSIFFIGDQNGLEIKPGPFIDNLRRWMGTGI